MPATDKEKEVEELQERLKDIKTTEGIIGYILRSSNSASIDLNDPTKVLDYAVLSTTALEAGQEISDIFEMGEANSTVLEGEDIKVLSMIIGDNRLSIFMEKKVDHNKLCKDLNPAQPPP